MSGSTLSSAGLDPRRRRLLFRVWRRGTREMDILFGRFADAHLAALDEAEVAAAEALLDLPDRDLYAWLTGAEPLPPAHDTPLWRRLQAFHSDEKPLRP